MINIINNSKVRSIIRNEIILRNIGKGKRFSNDFAFYPRNETGFREYDFLYPRFIPNRKFEYDPNIKNRIIDIKNLREGDFSGSMMNKGRKGQEHMWQRLVEEEGLRVLREHIILIEDIDLYRKCLEEEGATKDVLIRWGGKFIQEWYKNCLFVDLLLLNLGIIVELDYDSTHKHPEIDRARDRYIWEKYKLRVYRFRNYNNDFDIMEQEPLLINMLSITNPTPCFQVSYLDYIEDTFIKFYPDFVLELDNLISSGKDYKKRVDLFRARAEFEFPKELKDIEEPLNNYFKVEEFRIYREKILSEYKDRLRKKTTTLLDVYKKIDNIWLDEYKINAYKIIANGRGY